MHGRITWALAGWLMGGTLLVAQTPRQIDLGARADGYVVQKPADLPPTAGTESPAGCGNGCPQILTPEATGCYNPRCAGRVFGSVEYMLFDFRDGPAPPLIQHVPADRFMANGSLNPNDAITIFGDGIRHHAFNGVSAMVGSWFNECYGFDASYTEFETKDKRFFIASNGEPSIGRFYIDSTNRSQPLTYLIYSRPDNSESGFIDISTPTRLWYTDGNVRIHGCSVFADRVDWLVGFRYVDLREGLFIRDFTQFNDPARTSFEGEDRFYTSNQFYGPQIGANSWTELPCGFTLDVTGKIALGGVHQVARINGVSIERQNGQITRVVLGDVLTQPSNIGDYDRAHFAVVPEFAVKLGYRCGSRVAVTIGYNILAVSNVVRPGTVIDSTINPNLNPFLTPQGNSTAQRPGFGFNGTDFWAQGLTLGVSVTY